MCYVDAYAGVIAPTHLSTHPCSRTNTCATKTKPRTSFVSSEAPLLSLDSLAQLQFFDLSLDSWFPFPSFPNIPTLSHKLCLPQVLFLGLQCPFHESNILSWKPRMFCILYPQLEIPCPFIEAPVSLVVACSLQRNAFLSIF